MPSYKYTHREAVAHLGLNVSQYQSPVYDANGQQAYHPSGKPVFRESNVHCTLRDGVTVAPMEIGTVFRMRDVGLQTHGLRCIKHAEHHCGETTLCIIGKRSHYSMLDKCSDLETAILNSQRRLPEVYYHAPVDKDTLKRKTKYHDWGHNWFKHLIQDAQTYDRNYSEKRSSPHQRIILCIRLYDPTDPHLFVSAGLHFVLGGDERTGSSVHLRSLERPQDMPLANLKHLLQAIRHLRGDAPSRLSMSTTAQSAPAIAAPAATAAAGANVPLDFAPALPRPESVPPRPKTSMIRPTAVRPQLQQQDKDAADALAGLAIVTTSEDSEPEDGEINEDDNDLLPSREQVQVNHAEAVSLLETPTLIQRPTGGLHDFFGDDFDCDDPLNEGPDAEAIAAEEAAAKEAEEVKEAAATAALIESIRKEEEEAALVRVINAEKKRPHDDDPEEIAGQAEDFPPESQEDAAARAARLAREEARRALPRAKPPTKKRRV